MKWRMRATTVGRWCSLLFLTCMAGTASAQEPASADPVVVEYHQPTDLFNALDNLSGWLPGYTSPAYRDYWERHVGLDAADRAALSAYAQFRQRTSDLARDSNSDGQSVPTDIFAPASTRKPDAFSRHFLEARSFEAGVAAAIAAQSLDNQRMLRAYFARFVPRARHLIDVEPRFAVQRATLSGQLAQPAVPHLAEAIRTFYEVAPAPRFTARFVWWPDPDTSQAKVRGRYILLYSQHDATTGTASMDWAPIVLHEFSHYLSAGQRAEKKRRLTAGFLQLCPVAAELPNPLNALEEPLAIYWGQYRFEHDVRGGALSPDDDWYVQPWANRVAKAIALVFPATDPAPTLQDPRLIEAAASACAE